MIFIFHKVRGRSLLQARRPTSFFELQVKHYLLSHLIETLIDGHHSRNDGRKHEPTPASFICGFYH